MISKNIQAIIKKIILILLLVLTIMVSFNKYYIIIFTSAIINAIAVLGIIVISGYAKQLHLGQSAFVGIGAYTTGVLMVKLGIPFFATIPLAIIISGFLGWILSIPTLKLKGGSYLALVTQIFGEIIYVLLLNLAIITNGAFGIRGINAPNLGFINLGNRQQFYFFCLFCLIIIFVALTRILDSKYGRFFISIRESEDAAESLGISTRNYKMIAFIIAASIAGFSGCLYATNLRYLSPEQFRWAPSLNLVSMAIVGGLYSLKGGILGSIILTVLPEALRFTDEFRMIIYGIIVILVLAFLPNGIISLFGKNTEELKAMFLAQWDILSDKTLRLKEQKIKNANKKES
jgi:branched-chain amino acid transport system permease protein